MRKARLACEDRRLACRSCRAQSSRHLAGALQLSSSSLHHSGHFDIPSATDMFDTPLTSHGVSVKPSNESGCQLTSNRANATSRRKPLPLSPLHKPTLRSATSSSCLPSFESSSTPMFYRPSTSSRIGICTLESSALLYSTRVRPFKTSPCRCTRIVSV